MTDEPEVEVRHWQLNGRQALGLTLAGAAVAVAGMILFGALAGSLPGGARLSFSAPGVAAWLVVPGLLAALVGLMLLLMALHELCHGAAFRWFGARPQYGVRWLAWFCPIFYATAPGARLSRRAYLAVLFAPTVAVNLLGGLLLAAPSPALRMLLVAPLAMHLGGCVGDWWMAVVLARLPAGGEIEDTREGFSYRVPRAATLPQSPPRV